MSFKNRNLLSFLYKIWVEFSFLLRKFISLIIMALVFFLLVTPIGILFRILNKDVIGLKKVSFSYWINRENKPQNMKKQF
jgi:hypothetical protein